MNNILVEMYVNGFCKINVPSLFKYLNEIESLEWLNWKDQGFLQLVKRTPAIEKAIDDTKKLIGEKYIKKLDPLFKYGGDCEIVNGMDEATLSWHNDLIEGYNVCVLLYFDSMDRDIGGDTLFRHIESKESTGSFYPKKYDVSFMNHCSRFEHKVNPMKIPIDRRVALFNYNINENLVG